MTTIDSVGYGYQLAPMTTQSIPGSRWWKFDIHTHTPAGSDDYKGDPSGRGSGKSSIVECLRLSLGRGEEAAKMLGAHSEVSKSIDKFRDPKNGMIRPNTSLKVTVSGAGALGGMYRYDWSPSRLVAKRAANAELNNWTETPIAGDAITKKNSQSGCPVKNKFMRSQINHPGCWTTLTSPVKSSRYTQRPPSTVSYVAQEFACLCLPTASCSACPARCPTACRLKP
jgi:hypothetical protein